MKITLDASSRQVDENGFWYIPRNPISKIGVYGYLPEEVGGRNEDADDTGLIQVFKSSQGYPDTLLDSLKNKPIVIEHDWLGIDGSKDLAELATIGHVGEQVTFEDGILYADLHIQSMKAQDMIDKGYRELSLGSQTETIKSDGVFEGMPYKMEMFHNLANHVALVKEGRCGAECAILDKKPNFKGEKMKVAKKGLARRILDAFASKDEEKRSIDEIMEGLKDSLPEEYHASVAEAIAELATSLEKAEEKEGEVGGSVEVELEDKEEEEETADKEEIEEETTDEEEKSEDEEEDEDDYDLEKKVQDAIVANQVLRSNLLLCGIGNIPSHYTTKDMLKLAGSKLGISPTLDAVAGYVKARKSVVHTGDASINLNSMKSIIANAKGGK